MGWSSCAKRLSQSAMSWPCPMAASACLRLRPLPRFLRPMWRRPTPIAPDDTSTTLCPSARSLTTASTTLDSSCRRGGYGGLAATMDEVPLRQGGQQWGAPSLMTMVMEWALDLALPLPLPAPLSGEEGRVLERLVDWLLDDNFGGVAMVTVGLPMSSCWGRVDDDMVGRARGDETCEGSGGPSYGGRSARVEREGEIVGQSRSVSSGPPHSAAPCECDGRGRLGTIHAY